MMQIDFAGSPARQFTGCTEYRLAMRVFITLCLALGTIAAGGAQSRPDIYRVPSRVVSRWQGHRDPPGCKGCGPGEAMAEISARVNSTGYVAADNPPCGDTRFDSSRMPPDLKQSAAARFNGQTAPQLYALSFVDGGGGTAKSALPRMSSSLGQYRQGPAASTAGCARLIVTIPKEARVTRVLKNMNCAAGGWCGFGGEPVTEEVDKDLFAVSVVGKNWSNNQPATATLQVYYRR
jgi:hypothetical protein